MSVDDQVLKQNKRDNKIVFRIVCSCVTFVKHRNLLQNENMDLPP